MRIIILILSLMSFAHTQTPKIEPGVSQELAKWRAGYYSDVRYRLDLTLEKMSPVLRGTIEMRVNVRDGLPIILDWRKIRGFEERSTISNVSLNGAAHKFEESNEHLIFQDGVKSGENIVKLDFTSPILPSGSAITRYIDKEDGSEYIYSLFVPSDASTAFPVFDQPDLKAKFTLSISAPKSWRSIVSNAELSNMITADGVCGLPAPTLPGMAARAELPAPCEMSDTWSFKETKPISTYVFAFAAGPWEQVNASGSESASVAPAVASGSATASTEPPAAKTGTDTAPARSKTRNVKPEMREVYKRWLNTDVSGIRPLPDPALSTTIYVRRSQLTKFQPHAAEVFRLNRGAVKYFEEYFDYKFPFPKYDLVLIPEFPFGGMEHAGATFLREAAIIFPSEPTKNDLASRATLIFHEAAHQWFGDTVTMRWFDDLWLKEGFANFTAYKAMEKIMPEMNAWKIFYERIKQGAYQTDSTRGTTAIYQPIPNLSAAKSAYGNIVYNKAPAFLRQAEFYLGEDEFRTAVRRFLKKHEYANAEWTDLVREFEGASQRDLGQFAPAWVKDVGVTRIRLGPKSQKDKRQVYGYFLEKDNAGDHVCRRMKFRLLVRFESGKTSTVDTPTACDIESDSKGRPIILEPVNALVLDPKEQFGEPALIFPNFGDYGYGIFLLDDESRNYVLKNIQDEKDAFLRSMMWGALWDSLREGELDPKSYVELVIRNLPLEKDESISALVLGRVGTAFNYYLTEDAKLALVRPLELMLESEMLKADSLGRRITLYRSFLGVGASTRAREIYKKILNEKFWPKTQEMNGLIVGGIRDFPLKTKDRFDIVTRLLILGDPDAPKLLADLEQKETSDDAKRYAYAAKAGIASSENKEKFWNDFVNNKEISESWIEAAFGPFNSVRHANLTLPYLERALKELPNHKRNRKIFFVNGWLGAFIGGQNSPEALAIVNKFLADNPNLDRDLRLKILENVDIIERAVAIRAKYAR